ncbi:MAG: hypothetical protein D6689_03340 [Deltaproteobacteria bacterium]|nr:MAG: hypothetical protein D6689_03340 [Deltaproteobacteria bacterium]
MPPMDPRARAHLDRGLEHYRARDYEAAIREFRAGYAIDPRPELMFAIGQAERLSGDCASAIRAYREFLATDPPEPQAKAASAAIERCEVALGETGWTSAEIPDRGPPAAPARPAGRVPAAAPAAHAAPAPAAPAAAPGDDRRPWYRDPIGATLLGAGATSAAVGIGLFVSSAAERRAAADAATYGEYERHLDAAQSRRTAAWVGVGVGAGLASAAAVRYWLRRDRGTSRRDLTVVPTASGAALVVAGTF